MATGLHKFHCCCSTQCILNYLAHSVCCRRHIQMQFPWLNGNYWTLFHMSLKFGPKCPVVEYSVGSGNGLIGTKHAKHYYRNQYFNMIHFDAPYLCVGLCMCHSPGPPPSVWSHDDVIKWKHFLRYWPLVRGFTGPRWIPRSKASGAEPWCFLWSAPE